MNLLKNSLNCLNAFVLAGSICAATSFSMTTAANAQTLDKPAVEKIIREYLLNNPEIMIEVQQALEAKQEEQQKLAQLATLKDKRELLYNSENQMIIGDPNAKISLVEFFDYNCGFCKRALADMNRIVAENPDVNFIMKEFPVLGEPSLEAHRVSLAVIRHYPEKYEEYHTQLLNGSGRKDGNAALDLAIEMGADAEKIKATANDPAIMNAISEVYELADGLGITGTPSYVVGDEVVFGAVGYDALMPRVENMRKCGNSTC